MVKFKYIIIFLSVVIFVILATVYLFQSEEKKVKKQFDLLSKWASKDPGENTFTMMNKIKNIGALFEENCGVKIPAQSFSGSHTRNEITSYAAQGRLQFSQLHLEFCDLNVALPEKGIAKVYLTARLTGKLNGGEYVNEAHELDCVLKKIENKWLFSDIEVVEVLKK